MLAPCGSGSERLRPAPSHWFLCPALYNLDSLQQRFCVKTNQHSGFLQLKFSSSTVLQFKGCCKSFFNFGIKSSSLGTTRSSSILQFMGCCKSFFYYDKEVLPWVPPLAHYSTSRAAEQFFF